LDEITLCGYPICPKCKKANLTELLLNHVRPIKKLLNDRGITPIIYHDEFFRFVSGPTPTKSKPIADFPEKLGRDVVINSWEYNNEPTPTMGRNILARGFKDLIYMSYSINLGNSWKLPKIARELNAKGNILAHWYSAPATLDAPERSNFHSYPAIVAATLLVCGLHQNENFRISTWFARPFPRERAELEARYAVMRDRNARFTAISGTGEGMYKFMLRYAYEERFAGEVLIPTPEGERDCSATELREEFFGRARYVLVVHPHESLKTKYAEIWEEPPVFEGTFTLFEVTPEKRLRAVR
ncbi:MAG: hypothetical protein J6Y54_09525, partial [Lentisphaeria bacterium]|nr:hypothetical protein [Lentisphaeria bacterium]